MTRARAIARRRAYPLAWLVLDDRLRSDAPALIIRRERGWQILLLSGDSSPMVAQVAAEVGIHDARSA